MERKDILERNLTELVRLAGREGASGLTSFGILVMHNGSIEAWLHGEDGNYGCWSLGEHGEVVSELDLSREELLNLDIAVTAQWMGEMIAAHAKRDRSQLEPTEIYLGGELLAVRTKPYVMVAEAFQEIRPGFSPNECVFGFQRVRFLNGKDDPTGIMEDIFQECLNHLETHPEAVICVADEDDMTVFSTDDLPRLRRNTPR